MRKFLVFLALKFLEIGLALLFIAVLAGIGFGILFGIKYLCSFIIDLPYPVIIAIMCIMIFIISLYFILKDWFKSNWKQSIMKYFIGD